MRMTRRESRPQHSPLNPPTQLCISAEGARACTTPTLQGRHYRNPDPTAPRRPCTRGPHSQTPRPARRRDSPPPAAQVRAFATRHFRLQVSPPEDSRPEGWGKHGWLRWAPRQKARGPRREATAAWGARRAGAPTGPSVRLPNTHPGPRGCPDGSLVSTAAGSVRGELSARALGLR